MTAEFGDKTLAGMGPAHMAGSVGTVAPQARPVLAVCPRLVLKEV